MNVSASFLLTPMSLARVKADLPVEQRVVDHLRDAPLLVRAPPATAAPNTSREVRSWTSSPAPEGVDEGRVLGEVGQDRAARSGCSRRRAAGGRARPRRPRGCAAPPRCGWGCSAGSGRRREMRPVAATVWLNEAWMRPGLGVDEQGQRVHVGRLQLLHRAVLEDLPRQLVVLGQLLQHLLRGGRHARLGRLLARPHAQAVEEHVAQLDGRVDVERRARQLVDLRGEGRRSAAPCRGSSRPGSRGSP